MTENTRLKRLNRRDVLKTLGAGSALSIAGCTGNGNGNGNGTGNGTGNGNGTAGETLTIGMLAPLSGAYGYTGVSQEEGMEMIIDEMNQSDDILPDTQLDFISADTETDPDVGLTEARRLVEQDGVDLLAAGTSSAVAGAVAQYAEQQDMMCFLLQAADRVHTTGENCRPTTVRPNPQTHQAGRFAGEWATNNLGNDGFILYQDYSYGQATRDAVEEGIEGAGGSVAGQAGTPLGNQEFEAVIDQIIDTDPDWILMGAVGSGAVPFFNQAESRGIDIPMISQSLPSQSAGAVSAEVLDSLPDLYRCPALYTREIDSDVNREFVEGYTDRYDIPPNYSSEVGYMVGKLIAETLHESPSSATDDWIDTVKGFEFTPPRGTTEIRDCDHQGTPPLYVAEIIGIDEEYDEYAAHEIVDQVDSADYTTDCSEVECEF